MKQFFHSNGDIYANSEIVGTTRGYLYEKAYFSTKYFL